MVALRRRNALLLSKIEAAEGTPESLSASSDAILCENLVIGFTPNVIQTNEHTASLDGAGPIVAGTQMTASFDVFLKGSGTGGAAPEFGDLMKACALAETLTASAVPGGGPEACGAGGSTTTAELGSTAGTTAQQYRGMPINFTEEVTGTSLITNYTSGKIATLADTFAAIDADTDYQIPANARYGAASASIPTLTHGFYFDGLRYLMAGARGNMTLRIDNRGIGRFSFNFTGLFAGKTDTAMPVPTFDATRPPPFVDAVAKYNRLPIGIAALQFDLGNTLALPDNPNTENGFDPAVITARRPTISIDPSMTLVATRDILADVLANTTRILAVRLGNEAGNRVGIVVPKFQPLNETPGDREGILTADIPGEAVGADSGFFISFW